MEDEMNYLYQCSECSGQFTPDCFQLHNCEQLGKQEEEEAIEGEEEEEEVEQYELQEDGGEVCMNYEDMIIRPAPMTNRRCLMRDAEDGSGAGKFNCEKCLKSFLQVNRFPYIHANS